MEDRTEHWNIDPDEVIYGRPGLQTLPLIGSLADEALAEAIEFAITAGACRRAGYAEPERRATWNALAEARRRDAIRALTRWAVARLDEG
jgi:hypothetical protein